MLITIKILTLAIMLLVAYEDIKKKEISMKAIIVCALLALSSTGIRLYTGGELLDSFLSLLPGAIMLIIGRITKEEVGYGDGLMLMTIGPVFGLEHVMLGCFTGLFAISILSIFILVCRKGNRKTKIAFVPFLTLGMGVMMFA
nr:prepilin peptidase [uncultured Butyrivibrio sp.]